MDKLGVSSDRGQNELAVSYSVASTKVDEFYSQNSNNYKSPQMVTRLPKRKPLSDGTQIVPEVVSSSNDYYDGTKSLKLQTENTSCSSFSNAPRLCVRQENCGWCGASRTCIPGNGLGPRQPCKNNSFVYKAPDNWQPDN